MAMKIRIGSLQTLLLTMVLMVSANVFASREITKLQGTPISSPAVDYGSGMQKAEYAFDDDLNTYYASQNRSNTWVGLDLGSSHVITKIGFCPRQGYSQRTLLGLFEGANSPDFSDAVPLYIISETPKENRITYADTRVSRGFRYVRYVGPNDVRCNIAELEFYGFEGAGTDNIFYQLTNLPTVSIRTTSGSDVTSKDYEIEANVTITYDGCRIQEYPILIRGRGNASWSFPKKPYRIKFNDGKSHHIFKDSPLQTPAKAKKWTLINNYGDKTLMRNILAFEMSRRLGMPYTPYCQPVDVILNGEYKGCYQLCDQISVDPARVPVTEMEPTDNEEPELTGGYLLEVDAYAGNETSWFSSSRGMPVTIKSPTDDEITSKQKTYIRNNFNKMESAVWSSNYTNETTGYRSRLDVESFLRHFIVGEFSGNIDTYWSTYMYKERNSDVYTVSPCWDFDLAFDNDSRIYPVSNRSDWVFRSGGSSANGMSSFVSRILSDKYADTRLKAIWKDMRKSGAFSKESMVAYLDSMERELDASQRLNFIRWPILNQTVHMNVMALGSYKAEVQLVRDYLNTRIDWIDDYLGENGGNADTPADSTYEISNAQELMAFAKAVNAGANGSNAILTQDIDMSGVGSLFQPIGTGQHPYHGTFDGREHRILNLNIHGSSKFGVFGTVNGGAEICNLILDKSCSIQGGSYVGIVGNADGAGIVTMSRVGNEATITGAQNTAGIIGCNMGSKSTFIITDCYNTGNIEGQVESASISGWMGEGATLSGCWNIGQVSGVENGRDMARYGGNAAIANCYSTIGMQVNALSGNMLQSGELCFLLNGGSAEAPSWYQTLGVDGTPCLDSTHGKVYSDAHLHCDGTPYSGLGTYTNDETVSQRDAHDIVDGVCTYCHKFIPEYDDRGYLKIGTAAQFMAFTKYVNDEEYDANAVLTADIDLTDMGNVMVGYNVHYNGTFDGAGHTVTINLDGVGEASALFRYIEGTVMDLTVEGNIVTRDKFAGGIAGRMNEGKLLRCHSKVNIYSQVRGDGTHGGLIGLAGDVGNVEIESCLFSGSIHGSSTDCCGGFVGWTNSHTYISNSLMIGEISVGTNGSDMFCRNNGNMIGSNNYYLQQAWWPATYPWGISETTLDDMASGTLLEQLNSEVMEGDGGWIQDVGTDKFPIPGVERKTEEGLHVILKKGWNWIAHNRAEAVPVSQLTGQVSIVRSQKDELFKDDKLGWVGSLTTLAPLTAYKVYAEKDGELHLTSAPCDVNGYADLNAGWNWIGIPYAAPVPAVSVLSGYKAANGDCIVSMDGSMTYINGKWKGDLNLLQPGTGYLLKVSIPQKLIWPAIDTF